MNASDLRVFEAVARLGGIGRAAVQLNTVQSNVTAHIRDLEQRLGVQLLRRHSRGVELTRAGERLQPYATRLVALLADAARAVADDGEPRGQLVLGSLETTAAVHLSRFLARFAVTYPEVDLTLRTGTSCELLDGVLGRELEAAFVCGPVAHCELSSSRIWTEELVLLSAPGTDPFAMQAASKGWTILVLRAGCSYRQRLEHLLAIRGVPSPRVLEFGTLEAILACVGAGLGVTLLPRSLIARAPTAGQVQAHALPEHECRVDTVLIRRKDAYLSSALKEFVSMLDMIPPHTLDVAAE